MTSALKFRDMILSKFNTSEPDPKEDMAERKSPPENSSSAKSRLSFSVDSLLQKKIELEDEDIEDDLEDDIEEEEPEDLTASNNNDESKPSRIAMPTPLMANSLASNLIRPQPHFLAAGIAAMAAAAMANNAVTSNSTSSTSTPSITSNGPWSTGPPGHPTPPLSFPFGLPGLRHPLFSSGNYSKVSLKFCSSEIQFKFTSLNVLTCTFERLS